VESFYVENKNGWRLHMRRAPAPPTLAEGGVAPRPALLVPGYGMNSFIFGFHPRGPSLMEHLASRGIDAYTIDLRGQGESARVGGSESYGLAEMSIADVGAGIAAVRERTGSERIDLIGCSLGCALAFAHIACVPDAPIGSIVSLAGVVTWKKVHPLVKAAFFSPELAARVPFKNTRKTVRTLLPILSRVTPKLLGIYINAKSTDLSYADEMVKTVEDPVPQINREIAEWMKRKDLVVRGVNVSRALRDMKHPFLCVAGDGDGVVPKETCAATYEAIGSSLKEMLVVGGHEDPIAHGDLFLCNGAQERVYEPVAAFLIRALAEERRASVSQ
jgi:pimeloyl-ACP methyl ester carboxylesterase